MQVPYVPPKRGREEEEGEKPSRRKLFFEKETPHKQESFRVRRLSLDPDDPIRRKLTFEEEEEFPIPLRRPLFFEEDPVIEHQKRESFFKQQEEHKETMEELDKRFRLWDWWK